MRRVLTIGSGILAAAGLLIAGLLANDRPEDTFDRIQRDHHIRVGYAPEAPFAYRTSQGYVTGEAPEIARKILGNLGITQIDWVQTEWSALIPDMKAGRFDMIAAGMFVSCDRMQEIALTRPTYHLPPALLVARGNPRRLHSFADIAQRPALRLAVVRGAQEQEIAQSQGIAADQIVAVPDAQTGLTAVRLGRADALALTSLSARSLAISDPRAAEVAMPFEVPLIAGAPAADFGAFGVRPEDPKLLQALNQQLSSFVGSEEHVRLVSPFGFTPDLLATSQPTVPMWACP